MYANVGPIAATKMMCEEPVATQEATLLGGATLWGYDGGLVTIAYELDSASAHFVLSRWLPPPTRRH